MASGGYAKITSMAKTSSAPSVSSSQSASSGTARRARIVVGIAAVIVILSLISAFAWPGWAVRAIPESIEVPSAVASAKPTIDATALPDDASELVKALPESVSNYVRGAVTQTDVWKSSSPLEAYVVTYSTGDTAQDVTITFAQWADEEEAVNQYNSLNKSLTGKQIISGNIKVSGKNTGSYVVTTSAEDTSQATGIWRNDTVVFQATGSKQAVETIVTLFPL